MSLLLLCDTCSLLGNTETSFPKFGPLHLNAPKRSREVRRSEKELYKFGRWRLERDQVIGTKRTRTNENLNK